MQFHLNGFKPGDPNKFPIAKNLESNLDIKLTKVDVLIVGCGPAGLTLAAQLAAIPEITTRIVEQKSGPMEKGQADGISCRSMEMFQAFGFADRVMKEGCWVNETSFWKADPKSPENILRSGRVQDVEEGLSEMPHVILNQGRVHDMYLEIMKNSPTRLVPDYDRQLLDLKIGSDEEDFPITARLELIGNENKGQIETIKAKYVVGCDGARSMVRKSIGGNLRGDSADQAWGVMDVLPVTDFPDIRFKALIQSADNGNIVLIPREGGYMVRIYVELDKLDTTERVKNKNIDIQELIERAKKIFHPYDFDVKEVVWWSVYEIGQRLTDKFDNVSDSDIKNITPRVFIAGDACHTHSPKAGQGMNVSMGDTLNLGWKLISVLQGRSKPELLHSYSDERRTVAKDLIDFDREWANVISAPSEVLSSNADEIPAFQRAFIRNGHYTAGISVKYSPSLLTADQTWQHLAKGFEIGTRFHSAPVIRANDAKPVEIGHTLKVNNRWTIFAFAGAEGTAASMPAIEKLCNFLDKSPNSPIRLYTRKGDDLDSIIDFRAVFQQQHHDLDLVKIPDILKPQKGRYGLRDYQKVFCAGSKNDGDIFDLRKINREEGCILIVRPDQYVAHLLPVDAFDELAKFFKGILKPV